MSEQMVERRACARRRVDLDVSAAVSPEMALPRARAIDIGCGGLLMAFVEPIGFARGHKMLVSMRLDDFRFNVLASVVRSERGSDSRTYVAVEFIDIYATDYDDLCQRLDHSERMSNSASA